MNAAGPSLKDFILKVHVLEQYRSAMRLCNNLRRLGDKQTAADLQKWARAEFRANKDESDPAKVRRLIARAQSQVRDWKKTLQLAGYDVK